MADTEEAEKVLLGQAAVLGLAVDKRWSVETLALKVSQAQDAKIDADKAAFASTKKVTVLLLRDAFPQADEKHLAGTEVDVPVAMANQWIDAGVARRADKFSSEN